MILYLPHAAEVTVVCGAIVGACLAFLWYNAYPAQIFMGDTGSLMIGGLIGAIALMVKKELLLPLIAGISFAETLSVMLQVAYFRYTRRKYGEGRRIFRMSPLHHHFELSGWHEVKVVIRFWLIALLLNALAFITLKLR
jgi:phospho-N-acetylmuramoyl-pentapeptide-transferase